MASILQNWFLQKMCSPQLQQERKTAETREDQPGRTTAAVDGAKQGGGQRGHRAAQNLTCPGKSVLTKSRSAAQDLTCPGKSVLTKSRSSTQDLTYPVESSFTTSHSNVHFS